MATTATKKWYIPGGSAWYIPGGSAWYIPGGSAWYIPGGSAWYISGGSAWYISGALLGRLLVQYGPARDNSTLRAMLPRSLAWVDAFNQHGCRNQFLLNLALARLNCAVTLDEKFNMQLNVREVELNQVDGCVKPTYNGRPVHVLHFCGPARAKQPEMRDRLFPKQ